MMLEIDGALKPMFGPLRDLLAEAMAQVERGRSWGVRLNTSRSKVDWPTR